MPDQESGHRPAFLLDGRWELKGRSPLTAALFSFLVIGVLYEHASGFMGVIAALGALSGHREILRSGGNFFADLARREELLKEPLRWVLLISQWLFFYIPTVWAAKRWHSSREFRYLGWTSCRPVHVGLAVLLAIGFVPFNILLSRLVLTSLHVPDALLAINDSLVHAATPPEFLWTTLVICITPAICEETLFRGLLQRTMSRQLGWRAILVVGVIFGLFHLQPIGLVSLSLMGIMFGYVAWASGSIFPSMAAHFTNNFLVVVLSSSGISNRITSGFPAVRWFVIWTITILPCLLLLLWAFHRTRQPDPDLVASSSPTNEPAPAPTANELPASFSAIPGEPMPAQRNQADAADDSRQA